MEFYLCWNTFTITNTDTLVEACGIGNIIHLVGTVSDSLEPNLS